MRWLALIVLLCTCAVPANAEGPVGGSISGQVMVKDKVPMANGVVLLFVKELGPPPDPNYYWRIPDMIISTGKDGKFTVEVADGTYYMMAAQKSPDGEIGPPKSSEFLYFHQDAAGNAKPIDVSGRRVNLGVLKGGAIWTPEMVQREKGITGVAGTVTDLDDKPVENAVIFAYLSPEAMGRPAFVSDRTDANGRFLLRVNDGGTYYLKVRSVLGGGAPESGEYTNVSKDFEPTPVVLTKGQKLAVALKVERFSGVGSTGVAKPEKVWKKLNEIQAQ